MNRINYCFLACVVLLLISCKKDAPTEQPGLMQSPFISKILEYAPAPGQFINDKSYGTQAKAQDLIGGVDNGILSLGGYGGYLIFAFDHSIANVNGNDIGIYGNPLFISGAEWSEPGIVMVSVDANKNGLADDFWYELAGSEYASAETIKNYKITYTNPKNTTDDIKWVDNQGKSGLVLRNSFHAQNYFPEDKSVQNEISFTGTLLKNTIVGGGVIANLPFSFGYSDSGSKEYIDLQNQIGRGYNAFDISWAVDQTGNKANLSSIDFIKVYTGQNCNGNPYVQNDNPQSRFIGEVSTEIAGAIDIALYNKQKN